MASGIINTIDGVAPKVSFSKCDIDQLILEMDSHRNASGTLIRNIISTKRKIYLAVPPMRYSQLKQFIAQINKTSFSVNYKDLSTDTTRTGVFYCGDIKPSIYQTFSSGDHLMNAFSINFIEY